MTYTVGEMAKNWALHRPPCAIMIKRAFCLL